MVILFLRVYKLIVINPHTVILFSRVYKLVVINPHTVILFSRVYKLVVINPHTVILFSRVYKLLLLSILRMASNTIQKLTIFYACLHDTNPGFWKWCLKDWIDNNIIVIPHDNRTSTVCSYGTTRDYSYYVPWYYC